MIDTLIAEYVRAKRPGSAQLRALVPIGQAFGRLSPDQVQPSHVAAFRRARGVADSTVRRELGALVAVLNWAERTRLVPRGSVPHIDLPPPGQPRDAFMDEAQARTFHDAAQDHRRVGVFVSLALNTGARRDAIMGLTWDRVDLGAGTVDYREPGGAISRKRRVAVPINARLAGVLGAAPEVGRFVVGQGSLRARYEAYTSQIGMEWVTPHVLRHTAATLMLRAGVPLWDVAGVLGDTPETVARVYGHHSTTHLRGAVSTLGAMRDDTRRIRTADNPRD